MQYRHGFAAIVVGTMMVLSACTFEPKYVRPEASMSAPSAVGVHTSPAADVGWCDFFPDPQLQQLIGLAFPPTATRELWR
jgi:multidrug efflux system outer membrane protein